MAAALAGLGLSAYGSYTQGEAAKSAARDQANKAQLYQGAYGNYANWQNNGQQDLAQRLNDLGVQGYQNQSGLGQALGSPARGQAGLAAALSSKTGQDQALAQMQPIQRDTSWQGAPAAGGQWGQAYNAQRLQPQFDAKRQAIQSAQGQQGMSRYDRNALGSAGNTAIDLGRISNEAQNQWNAQSAHQQQILAQAGVNDQYMGPGPGYYNQMLFGGLANTAGQALMAYGSQQAQPSYGSSPYAAGGGGGGAAMDPSGGGGGNTMTGSGSSSW